MEAAIATAGTTPVRNRPSGSVRILAAPSEPPAVPQDHAADERDREPEGDEVRQRVREADHQGARHDDDPVDGLEERRDDWRVVPPVGRNPAGRRPRLL